MEDMERAHVPVGIEDYAELVTRYRCVDKTLLIKEMVDCPDNAYLFTRPRRFGKTLNLSMLKTFFEKTDGDTSVYFKDKKIWQCGEKYTSLQGKYPVICLTLKNATGRTWDIAYDKLKDSIITEYARHKELRDCSGLDSADAAEIERIKMGTAAPGEYERSLLFLSEMLRKKNGVKPIILIDEYDAPLQDGCAKGYYNEVSLFLSGFFEAALTANPNLEFAVIAGVLGIAGNLYGGLDGVKTYSVLDKKYGEFFGFTREETGDLLEYYGAEDKLDEVCKWYEGYHIGDAIVLNPWSVVKYVSEGFEPKDYWIKTGSQSKIAQMLEKLSAEDRKKTARLGKGGVIDAAINKRADYPALMEETGNVFTMLLMLGYLTSLGGSTELAEELESIDSGTDEDKCCRAYRLAAPDREVRLALKSARR
ncbi:MAG: AAA family ATPase [Clostridia bacterium]|nr:AAA family ATPase [Clostridia bacterium]